MKFYTMKKLLILLSFLYSINAVSQTPSYSKLKIYLKNKGLQELAEAGITVDHGHHKKGIFIINDFSAKEIDILNQLNYDYEILIGDLQKYYLEHRSDPSEIIEPCESTSTLEYEVPENFDLGSMGGYFTYDEIWFHIDKMANLYPDLITVKESIGDTLTQDGNPIYIVKISDNPNQDEDEPEMLYTALHHAREPGSVSQLIFFMYYMLEHYGEDEQITSIINNSELYFIPCINPDGYLHNELTDPQGGGMWRKNRRDNGDGSFGVDLNRNYDFHWAYDDQGSSPITSSQTYRGPAPASEPETQMVNKLCENHHFELTLNYHTYGGLLIYPWGYADTSLTPDSSSFLAFGEHLTQHNNYVYGTGTETVGYTVNGGSDDWMYGEQTTKNKILSMTPEAGSSFWENEDQILPTCKENLFPNISIASFLFPYASEELSYEAFTDNFTGTIDLSISNIGLQEGAFELILSSESPYVEVSELVISTSIMNHLQTENAVLNYSLAENTPAGITVEMVLTINNGIYERDIPISFIYGETSTLFTEDANTLNNWNTESWAISNTIYYSASGSITDSPYGEYLNDIDNRITLNDPIDLTNVQRAYLTFYTKWAIESSWDYAQLQISTDDGLNWTPVCGTYTRDGSEYQDYNQPIYDGVQDEWVLESIDLNDYIGETILLQFRMVSGSWVTMDGFYFDDLLVHTSSPIGIEEQEEYCNLYPNPSSGELFIKIKQDQNAILEVYNAQGQLTFKQSIGGMEQISIDAKLWADGLYFIKLNGVHQNLASEIWIKQSK